MVTYLWAVAIVGTAWFTLLLLAKHGLLLVLISGPPWCRLTVGGRLVYLNWLLDSCVRIFIVFLGGCSLLLLRRSWSIIFIARRNLLLSLGRLRLDLLGDIVRSWC